MPELGGWPLAGRNEELDVIGGAISNFSGSAGVAIVGALGVGKTRLAQDAVAKFAGRSIVHWAAGSSAAKAIPLGAFVNWLPPDVDDLLRATNRVIASLVGGPSARDCIVVVDDAHLLDDTSAFVLQRVIERRLARVVLTVCSGVAASDAVSALWRDDSMQRLDLQPLGRGDFVTLLESVLDGPMDPVTERKLWQLTRGNACFLRHIVEQEFNAGRIRRSEGTWLWMPGAVVPSPVCELVEHQMGELPDGVVDTVDLLSVAESLTLRMLVDLVGHEAVEEAEKRALIIVSGRDEPVVRLAHPLFGAVRRLKAGHLRLRRLRGMAGSRMGPSDDPGQILRRGVLLVDSDVVATADEMVRASEAALWRGDARLALRLAQAAQTSDADWRASLACAEALSVSGKFGEAESILTDGDSCNNAAVRFALSRAINLYLQGRTHDALTELQSSRGEFSAMRAFVSACAGDLSAAAAAADAALGGDVDDLSAVLATFAKVMVMGELGRDGDLEPALGYARAIGARSMATSFYRFALAEAHCSALQLVGAAPSALTAIESIRDDELPPDVYRWVSMMRGSANLSLGRVDLAVRQLRDALSAQPPAFLGGWLSRYYVDLAIALAVRGEPEAAGQYLSRLAALPHPETAYREPMEMLATAWISASTGALTRAIGEARSAAVTAASRGQPAREVLCLQAAVRFGDTAAEPRLAELAQMVGGTRAGAAVAHAAALSAGDGEGLMTVSERYAAMGDLLCAVDAAAQASAVFRHAGRRGSALGATQRARELARRCGRVRTPAMSNAAAPPVFTGRMREVVMLAGGGLSNREIAERLQLSIRTVEGHLYRAAGRVGARDRNELARTIGETLAVPA